MTVFILFQYRRTENKSNYIIQLLHQMCLCLYIQVTTNMYILSCNSAMLAVVGIYMYVNDCRYRGGCGGRNQCKYDSGL